DGAQGEMQDVQTTPEYTLPECEFTMTHATFRCWSIAGTEYDPGELVMLGGDSTIYAVWEEAEPFTISYSANGGEGVMADEFAYEGDTLMVSDCMFTAPDDKEFDYWRVVPGGAHLDPGDELEVDDDYVLVAMWKDIQGVIYEWVFFNGNGGEGEMDGEQVRNGDSFELPECEFTYEGYVFTGWDVNDESYAVGDSVVISGTTTVTAIWQVDPDYVDPQTHGIVNFSSSEGSGAMNPAQVEVGQSLVLPACTLEAPQGKQFKCWSVGGQEKQVGDSIVIQGDTTVLAVWEDIPQQNPENPEPENPNPENPEPENPQPENPEQPEGPGQGQQAGGEQGGEQGNLGGGDAEIKQGGKLSGGAIAGIVIAVVVAVAGAGVGVFFALKKKKA
ncbi:MAG: InlB B-repeat-containing protein, partial [Clostridia bacterium]|nr:InlB B-repeat-containing protein [Clostridia bacterium]